MGARRQLRSGRGMGTRRFCVPPAIMRSPGETMDGIGVLAESSGDLGLLLWRTARDVMLWGQTPPDQRGNLFADGSGDVQVARLAQADPPSAISASIDSIHGMLTLGARADAGVLSLCCLEVAAWAHKAGLSETAVTFAQAGAVAAPAFGEAALHTGIYARRAGQVARAATWLRRAVAVSRWERNRPAYSEALVELGVLNEGAGRTERAERFFRLGYLGARRFSARGARMRAAHSLFRLARARGDFASAAQFALAAQRTRDPDVGGQPALLLDLARFWMDLGETGRVRSALRRLAQSRTLLSPADKLVAAALTARAFAVRGTCEGLAAARRSKHLVICTLYRRTAWRVMQDPGISDDVRLAAALDLAHAAREMDDLVAFRRARRAALTLAPQSSYPAVVREMAELWPPAAQPAGAAEARRRAS